MLHWTHLLIIGQLYLAAVHQAAPNSTVHAIRGEQYVTETNLLLFCPSLVIIWTIMTCCCSLALASMVVMMCSNCSTLDLGFSPQQVARLVAMEQGKRQERSEWYLHMHPRKPCITVSTNLRESGDWAEEEVRNRHRKRN